jgi:hypothetical protein
VLDHRRRGELPVGVGTCVLDANQAGNGNYAAAPQVQQTITVGKGSPDHHLHLHGPEWRPVVGGATYTPTATGGASGNPVAITIDATTSGASAPSPPAW